MLEIKGLRHPTGCTLIVKALLSASVFASAGCAQLPHGRAAGSEEGRAARQLELLLRAGYGLARETVAVAGVRGSAAEWPD